MGFHGGIAFYVVLLLSTLTNAQLHQDPAYEIENLQAEPNYRAVKLSWSYPRGPDPSGFTIRVCELTGWRSKQPCRLRHLSLDGSKQKYNVHDVLRRTTRGRYEADVYQLRMFTNYSFTVEPNVALHPLIYSNREFERAKLIRPKNVQVATKGFSARASRCLGNSTDVEVQTGPFFAGKISVEDVQDEKCAIYGHQTDSQSVYTLTIDHSICGSKKVNNSRIETPVLVHENKELVTHNSRRFLVVCNFLPDNFTIKASLNIPTIKGNNDNFHPIGHSILEADPNEIFDDLQEQRFKQNNVKDSRILAEQAAVVAKTSPPKRDGNSSSHLVATVFLTTTFTVVFIGAMFWIVKVSRSIMLKNYPANNNDVEHNDANEKKADSTTDSSSVILDDEETLVQDDISFNIDCSRVNTEGIAHQYTHSSVI